MEVFSTSLFQRKGKCYLIKEKYYDKTSDEEAYDSYCVQRK